MKSQRHHFFFRNGLSIVFVTLFIVAILAQAYFGWQEHNHELEELGAQHITFASYLLSGHFMAATFENFQSEFLQMALYVILTISLRQIGSAESKDLLKQEDVDRTPDPEKPDAPSAVKRGGWRLAIYQNSLAIAFIMLFVISWAGHLYGSFIDYNQEQELKDLPTKTILNFLKEPLFWFETFQNWQSEFLSVASIVILTIFLRQKGSPESKPVDAGHMETGK